MKKTGLIIILSTFIFSCSSDDKQESESVERIVFGQIYGQCAGDCRNLYLLTEQGIYADSNSNSEFGDWDNTTFETQPLSMEEFELARQLLQFPNSLLESKDEITEQSIADLDYFLQIKTNKRSKIWVFDNIRENTDSEIKNYMENIIEISNRLSD